jgi:Mrp family chromosome partitioning ATPase/capsular polysaccharide biosynthesis protein
VNPIRKYHLSTLLGTSSTPVESATDVGLLTAVWRRRRLVFVIMGLALVLGILYSTVRGEQQQFGASAAILLQEPDAVLEGGVASERFVASQVQIMGSQAVVEAAVALLAEGDPPVETSTIELLSETEIFSTRDSALVVISVITDNQAEATLKANAMAEGYRSVSRLQVTSTSTAALEQIDAQLQAIVARRGELEAEITNFRLSDPALGVLEAQMKDALARISGLQTEMDTASTEEKAVIRQEIGDLLNRVEVYRQSIELVVPGTILSDLLEERDQLRARRNELTQRRDQIVVDRDLARDTVGVLSLSEQANQLPQTGMARILVVALVLGGMAGAVVAFLLESRRRRFTNRTEPESLLRAPLLADIPHFTEEGLETSLPVRDAPRSAAAEAFRFAAGSIEEAMRATNARSVIAVSPTIGHGKTTVLVNVAAAVAGASHSVLLVDSDFGNQAAIGLLVGDGTPRGRGLTEIVMQGLSLEDATRRVAIGSEWEIDILGRGQERTTAPDVLRSTGAREVFQAARDRYDLVLVDAPPFLQVAYSALLATYVDAILVVISHETPRRHLEDLISRLNMVRKPVIGYVYNMAPLRPEMTVAEGSMKDILGDLGWSAQKTRRVRVRSDR